MRTRIDWSVFISVTNIKSSYDVEKWRKRHFFTIQNSFPIFFVNDVPHERSWIYLALLLTFLKVRRADSLAKNNFVWTTFWKFGAVCDRVRKVAEHSCSNHLNLEIDTECLTKTLSYLNLNISRTKNGRNKL